MFSKPKLKHLLSAALLSALCLSNAHAQLSQNPDKFLGNITTYGTVNPSGLDYSSLWNQITPENETKWASCERNQGSYSFNKEAYNYAKNHNFPFKFHTLVWGSQFPDWVKNLTPAQRYTAIVNWMDKVKAEYPDLKMIDVVNEAIQGHQQDTHYISEALGGGGRTGYDWIIKAFEMAYERWPDAILIYNDFNTFQWNTDQFIDLVRTLRDAGAPIDAYGCQSHDMLNQAGTDTATTFRSSMDRIHEALMMPMFSTEYDVGTNDDALQLKAYKSQIPYMWEKDYCAGITLWGYVYGATWTGREEDGTKGNSGIIKSSGSGYTDRPAMQWLRDYMESPEAINAKSPFPGMKKQISLYIKPATTKATRGDTLSITVRAKMVDNTKSIDSIKLYVNGKLDTLMTDAPYIAKYVPAANGKYPLKAIVYASDGSTYEREGSFTAYNPRATYGTQPISVPGTIQAEFFDKGGDGVTYHDSNSEKEGEDGVYRDDCEGVDIVNGNGGKVIGYTNTDEWLEYTVNVAKAGYYTYEAVVSSGTTTSGFRLDISDNEILTDLTGNISVPQTAANKWDVYQTVSGRTLIPLKEGEQVIRLTITGSSCNIDKITLKHLEIDNTLNLDITSNPKTATAGSAVTMSFTPIDATKTDSITSIRVYTNGKMFYTIKNKPFNMNYTPQVQGKIDFSAIAVDKHGCESDIAYYTLTVTAAKAPYSDQRLPGTIQAENFDKGGSGKGFKDSDDNDEGKTNYRIDNEGADIVSGNGGYALGYTKTDEWYEYTVNIDVPGRYTFQAYVSSGSDNSKFSLYLNKRGNLLSLADVDVPNTGSWDTYTVRNGRINYSLPQGEQIIRLVITGDNCNIDRIEFTSTNDVKYITQDDFDANGTRYNLGGTRVNEYRNGINIMNGKKVLILE